MAESAEKILAGWNRSKAKKSTRESFVLQILEYLEPSMTNRIQGRRTDGGKNTDRQFDSAGEDAGSKLAASMAGTLTSSSQKWFSLVARQSELRELQEVMDWLEECADRLYFSFNQSNFHSEINEVYYSLVYTGLGGIMQEETKPVRPGLFGGFRYRAMGYGEYAIEEDLHGRVNCVYRTFETTFGAALREWGDAIGRDHAEHAKQKPEDVCEVLHAVYPRSAYAPKKDDKKNMPFASCYLMLTGAKIIVAEGGFREFPYAVPRWRRPPGEIYGRGPGDRAYPDVRSQNKLVELELEAGSKAVDPPLLQMAEAIMGDTSLVPAGVNIVDAALVNGNVRNAIAPLESASRFDWSKDRLSRLEQKIRQSFFNDHLIIPDKPDMTATEFAGRQEIMQRMIGPTMGRMHFELLQPIVDRAFNLMFRAGALPPVPEILAQYAGGDIDVVFEGPLARAQRSHDLVAIQRKNEWLAMQLQMGNTDVKDLFDPDAEARELAMILGVPANIVRSERVVAAMRQQRQQVQKRQAMMEQMSQLAESAGAAAPMIKALPEAQEVVQGASGGR